MASLMLVNPRKRRAKKRKSRARSKVRTITKYRTRKPKRKIRRRRNPIAARGLAGVVTKSAKNGAIGSLGAIAGTIVGNFLPVPDSFKEGNMAVVVQALVGIGTGYAVSKFMSKGVGEQMAQGAVTVALHDTMKGFIQNAVPTLNLNGYDGGLLGGYDDSLLGVGEYDDLGAYADLGEYDTGMGYSGAGYTGAADDFNLDDQ